MFAGQIIFLTGFWLQSLQHTSLISSNPLPLLHWGNTTATHTLHFWSVGNDLHSRQIGFSINIWRMCYDDCVSIVSCSGALQSCVQIHLFAKSLKPKMNTHKRWDIVRTRTESYIYTCNIYNCYSTRFNFKLKYVCKNVRDIFLHKQYRKTHVKKRPMNFQNW